MGFEISNNSGVWLCLLVVMFWHCFCSLLLEDSTMASLFSMLKLFALPTLLLLVRLFFFTLLLEIYNLCIEKLLLYEETLIGGVEQGGF